MKSTDTSLFDQATTQNNVDLGIRVIQRLPRSKFTDEISGFMQRRNEDIRLLLLWLARRNKPLWYCEIGVRRGHSMAMVVTGNPIVNIVACDMWIGNYGLEENGSPEYIRDLMDGIGHAGKLIFLNGRSQVELPRWLDTSATMFDLALVDGDHSTAGTLTDLRNVLPRMSSFGHVVVDDLHDSNVLAAWAQIQKEYPDLLYITAWRAGVIYGFA